MIHIHPDIIDQLEEWVRGDPRRSMSLAPTEQRGVWQLRLGIATMPPGKTITHEWRVIMVGKSSADLVTECTKEMDELAARLPKRIELPTSEEQFDWLCAWPSHRIERSHRLMLHMLETDRPWTGRYLSD